MFGLGEKVKLIASSCHKKIGPRKNSIGYITTFDTTLLVSDLYNVVTMSADIKFLQYGNEKNHRFETKRVELVFPILSQTATIEELQKFLHMVDKNTETLKKIRSVINISDDIPIVIAVPIYTPEINFETCSNQEFSCWFESCIMSPQMNLFINEAILSQHLFQSEAHMALMQNSLNIRNMALDRHIRQHTLKIICENKSQRKKWVNILRILTITMKLTEQKEMVKRLRNNLYYANSHSIYFVLIPYLFYFTFFIFENVYIKNKKFNKVLTEIETTKTAMLALSTKNLN